MKMDIALALIFIAFLLAGWSAIPAAQPKKLRLHPAALALALLAWFLLAAGIL